MSGHRRFAGKYRRAHGERNPLLGTGILFLATHVASVYALGGLLVFIELGLGERAANDLIYKHRRAVQQILFRPVLLLAPFLRLACGAPHVVLPKPPRSISNPDVSAMGGSSRNLNNLQQLVLTYITDSPLNPTNRRKIAMPNLDNLGSHL